MQNGKRRTGQAELDIKKRTGRRGQAEQDIPYGTGRTGQAEQDIQNAGRTGQAKMEKQNGTVGTGLRAKEFHSRLPGKDCTDRTARKGLSVQGC
jgi:hypothetical protein